MKEKRALGVCALENVHRRYLVFAFGERSCGAG